MVAGAEVDFAALPIGASIGRFEVTGILGQGGFGITYRARDEQLGRGVAIKEYLPVSLAIRQDGVTVLPRSTNAAADFTWGRERFVAEGRTLASLNDAPAIVRVHDFLELNGTAYIVMELVRGETLEDRIKKKGKLTADEVQAILWPLLDGLEQVHKAGFLHRDIKPANILLREDGRPTLIDFGASRAAMADRTTSMTAIFTPGYAAAEQMTAAKQGAWSDIYGLAATLYHAIAGAPPPSAIDRVLDDEYVPLATRAPAGFSPSLLAGIDAGLAVRAGDRPQSVAGWRTVLGGGPADGARTTVVIAPPAARAPAAAPMAAVPKRIGLLVAFGVGAVVVLALGGYAALGGFSAGRPGVAASAPPSPASPSPASPSPASPSLPQAPSSQDAETELARLRQELEAQRQATIEQRQRAELQARRADGGYAVALRQVRPAAEAGQAQAQYELGAMYAQGLGVERNQAVAAEWYRKAAEQGNVQAQLALGSLYRRGQGVLSDQTEAATWIRKAAEAGDATGQDWLAEMYEHGVGMPRDYAQSAAWYRKSADQGNPRAMSGLAWQHLKGLGMPADSAAAAALYQKAAAMGLADAQFNLALLNENGDGVAKDPGQAAVLYRKAAEQGDVRAQVRLALLFEKGVGVPKDLVQAMTWASIAAARRSSDGARLRDRLAPQLTPAQLTEAKRAADAWKPSPRP